jgi:periplasmic protein CpxP/Spy
MHLDTASPPSPVASARGRGRGRWLVLPLIVAAMVTGAVASRAIGQHAFGPPLFAGPLDPAAVEDRADRMVRHVAIEIDASNDQQEKLRAIVRGAVRDLLPMREKSLTARQRAQTLLTAPAIDRGAIEQFRVEQMALAEAASKRFAQAIEDAADVLSPEQRRKLNERLIALREERGFWHAWHRG